MTKRSQIAPFLLFFQILFEQVVFNCYLMKQTDQFIIRQLPQILFYVQISCFCQLVDSSDQFVTHLSSIRSPCRHGRFVVNLLELLVQINDYYIINVPSSTRTNETPEFCSFVIVSSIAKILCNKSRLRVTNARVGLSICACIVAMMICLSMIEL